MDPEFQRQVPSGQTTGQQFDFNEDLCLLYSKNQKS